jgi:hypothetical protein
MRPGVALVLVLSLCAGARGDTSLVLPAAGPAAEPWLLRPILAAKEGDWAEYLVEGALGGQAIAPITVRATLVERKATVLRLALQIGSADRVWI